MLKKFILFFLLVTFSYQIVLFGQNNPLSNLRFDARIHYGFLAPHHETLRYLQRGHIPSVNLKISKSTENIFPWATYYRNPDIGFAYYYADLKWDDVLGNVSAIYTFISLPVSSNKFINSNYYVETGVSILSEHFDVDNNYYNIAIGSAINFYFSTGIDLNIRVNDNLYLTTGVSLKHFSNGVVKKPNKGINLIQANAGMKYYLSNTNPQSNDIKNIVRQKYFSLIAIGNVGVKQIYPPGGVNFLIASSNFEAIAYISSKRSISIGYDLFYDGSIGTRMKTKDYISDDEFKNLRQGIHLGFNTHFGPAVFSFQVGSYVFLNWNDDEPIYSRLNMRYHHKRLIYSLSLKTHYGRADYIEWGIGYILWTKAR